MFTLTPSATDPGPWRMNGRVTVTPEAMAEIERRAGDYVERLSTLPTHSPEFGMQVDRLDGLGHKEIRQAASQFDSLPRQARDMNGPSGTWVDLARLRGILEDLDPARHGDLSKPRMLLGIIPTRSRLTGYFARYSSAQNRIATILRNLASSRDDLLRDGVAMDAEHGRMREAMGELERMVVMAGAIEKRIEEKAADLEGADIAKAKALRETALLRIRQRQQDLATQMAVSTQAQLALDLAKRSNGELIKGLERASTTVTAALQTAVTVARALTDQRLVLLQIDALSGATSLAESAEANRTRQPAAIVEPNGASTIPLGTLQRAFQNIYDTMDSIDGLKTGTFDPAMTMIKRCEVKTGRASGGTMPATGQLNGRRAPAAS